MAASPPSPAAREDAAPESADEELLDIEDVALASEGDDALRSRRALQPLVRVAPAASTASCATAELDDARQARSSRAARKATQPPDA